MEEERKPSTDSDVEVAEVPFSPDGALRRARGAAVSVQRLLAGHSDQRLAAASEQALILALNFSLLDEYLAGGGELPVSWSR